MTTTTPSTTPPGAPRRRRAPLVVLAVLLVAAAAAAGLLLLGPEDEPKRPADHSLSLSPPTGVPGKVTFDGDFRRGLGAWPAQIHPERITVVDDPLLGSRRRVAKFTVNDGDVGPTPNPRAQLESPSNLEAGGEYWVGWSTLFPEDFPVLPRGGWFTLQSVYGPPSKDSGPLGTRIAGGDLRFERNDTYDYDLPWSIPLPRGRWIDFAYHFKLSRDDRVGFVELFLNTGQGWQRQILLGRRRLYMKTLDASNGGGPNSFRVNNYRKRGMYAELTIFHASPKVGTSFDAVAPRSYAG